jgi:hypothetical protein
MCVKHGAQCKSAPFNLKLEAHDAILVTRLYVQVLKTLFLSERHNNCVCSPPLPLPPDMCGVCVCVCVCGVMMLQLVSVVMNQVDGSNFKCHSTHRASCLQTMSPKRRHLSTEKASLHTMESICDMLGFVLIII